jgi:Aromatic amino acid lyase
LEDLVLTHHQVTIEVNSVTDNPLVYTDQKSMLHGGNFQAKAIISAMEKARQSCQTIGRMLSEQSAELINPMTNRGLPPNLVIDEPSESFIWKGTDIMVAALQSELGFLANPVGTHVQTAEMGNQAINSLALISARHTLDAVDVLTQLSAVHLIALCQTLDLRAININFEETFRSILSRETHRAFDLVDKVQTLYGPDYWYRFRKTFRIYYGFAAMHGPPVRAILVCDARGFAYMEEALLSFGAWCLQSHPRALHQPTRCNPIPRSSLAPHVPVCPRPTGRTIYTRENP